VAAYGQTNVISHGTAVWRFQQLKILAENALASNDMQKLLQMAGVMSHYLADLSQPLHVTINYDGQMTNQNGIHKFFETTNLSNRDYDEIKNEVVSRAKAKLLDSQFVAHFSTDPQTMIFSLVDRSYSRLQGILDVDEQLGRNPAGAEKMYGMAIQYMADGAAILSLVLDQIASLSPNGLPGQTMSVNVPAWVAPNYATLRGRKKKVFQQGFLKNQSFNAQADCQETGF
jgi:hypothetical protein